MRSLSRREAMQMFSEQGENLEPGISIKWRFFIDNLIAKRMGKCDVHWGIHSCDVKQGHRDLMHICECGRLPGANSILWGDDAPKLTNREREIRNRRLTAQEEMREEEIIKRVNKKYCLDEKNVKKKRALAKKK